ncbi:peroxidase family protein [Amycolatopsis sp. cg5]|uniref:peroxidase family protein n=1 Tax=Amycolatopsis sp. cg5 TaxID=3238802 RepID=UPI0035244C70
MRKRHRVTKVVVPAAVLLVLASGTASASGPEYQSLDGSGNNRAHPDWVVAGSAYLRVAGARYVDGIGVPVTGPNARRVSNRIFNDTGQRLNSPRGMSQWTATWGQFLDHTFGLRKDGTEVQPIPFDPADPLERFPQAGGLPVRRSVTVPGTGPRQQVNLLNSYLDAFAVYGGTADRLEWLREGPVDGDLSNNGPHLLLPGGMLPRRDERGDARTAPGMDDPVGLNGRAAVTGDHRANENIGLLSVQNLFAREHNRIVDRLPGALPAETKFQIARRVVIATQQYITFEEFLPSLGVRLAPYRGYNAQVNPTVGNEFATVGYRAHSMLNGDLRFKTELRHYTQAQLDALRAKGLTVTVTGDAVEIKVPSEVATFNPDLVTQLQLGPVLQGLGAYPQSASDEQIGDLVRNIVFRRGDQIAVFDIGAIDLERGRDHGMPTYQQLRQAYGLAPKASFSAVTGEATETFPADPELTPGAEIDDPDALDFVRLFDAAGNPVPPGGDTAVKGERRTTLASRLKALYGDVNTLEAFPGLVSEKPVPGSEFGELQLAIWKKQFEAMRDGDRFFYGNDPSLVAIKALFGIDFRQNLGDVIARNTDVPRGRLAANVFRIP